MKGARLQVAFGGLHPERVRDLYTTHGPVETLRLIGRGSVKTTDRIRAAVAVPARQRRAELAKAGIEVIYRGDGAYPAHLADLPDAPDTLFVRGVMPMEAGVAVVGARRCTGYGRRIASAYGQAIAAAGWPVVSGLARGIDGAGHEGTVAAGGVGVAVLGSGIDVMYPREHAQLALDLIANGGAVISEAPPGSPPEAWRFPPRNRIISGLSAVVVVVEATVKGGALITAESALRQGRQVFAVPGDVGRASSEGCNLLIRDGAFPVLDPDDLVESLELVLGPSRGSRAPSVEMPNLDPGDRFLVELIMSGIESVDELLVALDIGIGEGLARLGNLELAGLIKAAGPGRYLPG